MGQPAVLNLSPFATIFPHSIPESIFIRSIQPSKHSLTLGCRGILQPSCAIFETKFKGKQVEKEVAKRVCNECIKCQKIIARYKKSEFTYLEDHITRGTISKFETLVNNLKHHELLDIEVDGLKIGKMAIYETILHYQKGSVSLSPEAVVEFKRYLISALVVQKSISNILNERSFDIFVVYNRFYSLCNVAASTAESYGIKNISLHAGGNLSGRLNWLNVFKGHQKSNRADLIERWATYSRYHLTPESSLAVRSHMDAVIDGRSSFSFSSGVKNRISIREYFNVKGSKNILLATLSSEDERFAAEIAGLDKNKKIGFFSDQLDWVEWLCKFAEQSEKLHIIIRLHPRLMNKNKRDPSEIVEKLRELSKRKYLNVSFNFPQDGLSTFDFMGEVKGLLNYHSTTGLEFLFFGLPVLIWCASAQAYPQNQLIVAYSKDDYACKINNLAEEGLSIDRAIFAHKWLSMLLHDGSFQIRDSFLLNLENNGNRLDLTNIFSALLRRFSPTSFLRIALLKNVPGVVGKSFRGFLNSSAATKVEFDYLQNEGGFRAEDMDKELVLKNLDYFYRKLELPNDYLSIGGKSHHNEG